MATKHICDVVDKAIVLTDEVVAKINEKRNKDYSRTFLYMNPLKAGDVSYIDVRIVSSSEQLKAIRYAETARMGRNAKSDRVHELKTNILPIPGSILAEQEISDKICINFQSKNDYIFGIWPGETYKVIKKADPKGIPLKEESVESKVFFCVSPENAKYVE